MLTDDQLLRYSRHIMLGDVDVEGQERWFASRVLIIGLGGLGSPVSMYLAAAGIGTLVLVDDDEVDSSNLQRQIVHAESTVGMSKVGSAAQRLSELNPEVSIEQFAVRLEAAALREQVAKADLVVDCSDNFDTRFAVNHACVVEKTPLVVGAAIRMEGQLMTVDPRIDGAPCYQCLYPTASEQALSCSESGVLSPLVGAIGSIQALEALKVLAGVGEPLIGRVQILDAKYMQWRELKLKRDPECRACGAVA
ncbi:MAG: HesA/MoeB/ThiF family protein [Pseudomonadales bacterium]